MWLDNRMDSVHPFLLGRRQLVVLSMLSLVEHAVTSAIHQHCPSHFL